MSISDHLLLGARIMFSWRCAVCWQRRRLCTHGAEGTRPRVDGTVQSRDGACLCAGLSPPRAAATGCTTRNPAAARLCRGGSVVTLYYDPEAPEKMYVEGDRRSLGAEALYAVIGVALLVLTVRTAR